MLTKEVWFAEKPDNFYIFPIGGTDNCRVDFPVNIQQIEWNDILQWQADIYSINVLHSKELVQEIEDNYDEWLENAKHYETPKKRNLLHSAMATPSGNQLEPNSQTYTLTMPTTIYGGYVNFTTGKVTSEYGYIASYNGEALPGVWISNLDTYNAGTAPTIGAEVIYQLATPNIYSLTGMTIYTITATNIFSASSGDINTLTYHTRRIPYTPTSTNPLQQIVYLSEEQANLLFDNGAITENGETIVYNDNNIYLVPDTGVIQAAAITTAGAYPVILANSTATTAVTGSVNKTSTLTYNPSTKALVTGGTINGYTLGAASAKGVTDNSSATAVTSTDTNLITARTLYNDTSKLEFITSTNSSQSNSLTGTSTATSIADGKIIIFYNQYAITGQATLNLTLASSGNTTSAIPIYVYGSTRSETQYPAGSMIPLVYYNSKFYIIQSGPGFVD